MDSVVICCFVWSVQNYINSSSFKVFYLAFTIIAMLFKKARGNEHCTEYLVN